MPLVVALLGIGLAVLAAGTVLERRATRSLATAGSAGAAVRAMGARTTAPVRRARRACARGARRRIARLFLTCATGYLAVGAYLVLHRHIIVGDAAARVAQAWYVVASRDPHLAAIGFVWNPLPSVAEIPLVALRGVWPALTRDTFAGCIVSALFMAGAVVQLRACLRELRVSPRVMSVLVAGMAISPMVVMYGANGMSEAMYLCFLLGVVRYLVEWTVSGTTRPLVLAGVDLAGAVLTREEAVAALIAVAITVFAVGTTARDHRAPVRERAVGGLGDAIVVVLPGLAAFVAWTLVSWVIVGDAFVQFNSRYGNASILNASGTAAANGTGWPRIVLALVQAGAYAPLGVLVGLVAAIVAWWRRDRRALALVALVAPLAFSIAAYTRGQTFGFLRYYIPALPLALLSLAFLLHPLPRMRPSVPRMLARESFGATALAAVVVATSLVTTAVVMTNVRIAPAEQPVVAAATHHSLSVAERHAVTLLDSAHHVARAIDRLGLASRSIAVDTFNCGSLIVLGSRNPAQFIITSDRDFERVVADPAAFRVPYVLVPNADLGIEAIGLEHPGIFSAANTDGLRTEIVGEWQTTGCPTYRLIHVVSDGS